MNSVQLMRIGENVRREINNELATVEHLRMSLLEAFLLQEVDEVELNIKIIDTAETNGVMYTLVKKWIDLIASVDDPKLDTFSCDLICSYGNGFNSAFVKNCIPTNISRDASTLGPVLSITFKCKCKVHPLVVFDTKNVCT